MAGNYAFATLLTSDSYLPGALVLGGSIKATGTAHAVVALVTPESVSALAVQDLHRIFDQVLFVPTVRSNDVANLGLLGRRELDITYTKIHVFDPDVMPFERVVFMDADVLVLRNVDDLFGYLDNGEVFAAAPDVGWPDCFNSGVFVCRPDMRTFMALEEHSRRVGSFDGGDQGLLNSYFSGWAHGRSRKGTEPSQPTARLPFTYNVTPSAFYSYLPAYMNFYRDISVVHFIGQEKPWQSQRTSDGTIVQRGNMSAPTLELYRRWWQIYDRVSTGLQRAKQQTRNVQRGNQESPVHHGRSAPTGGHSGDQSRGPTDSVADMHEFSNYRVQWNQAEVSPPKGHFPELASPTGEHPDSSLQEEIEIPLKSPEGFKQAWEDLEPKPRSPHPSQPQKEPTPAIASPAPQQSNVQPAQVKTVQTAPENAETPDEAAAIESDLSPYQAFELKVSPYARQHVEPSGDLGNYRVAWDDKELGRKARALQRVPKSGDEEEEDQEPGPVDEEDQEAFVARLKAD
ncbi:glycogenin glucosyltransferase, partial [Borealophlyctis nickersoniae]